MANPVVHFEVLGSDAETLKRFYGEAFSWQMQDVMEGSYYMVNTGVENGVVSVQDGVVGVWVGVGSAVKLSTADG